MSILSWGSYSILVWSFYPSIVALLVIFWRYLLYPDVLDLSSLSLIRRNIEDYMSSKVTHVVTQADWDDSFDEVSVSVVYPSYRFVQTHTN